MKGWKRIYQANTKKEEEETEGGRGGRGRKGRREGEREERREWKRAGRNQYSNIRPRDLKTKKNTISN